MIVDSKANKQIVGAYLMDGGFDGFMIGMTKKPNLIRRVATRLVLGWKWVNIDKLRKNRDGN